MIMICKTIYSKNEASVDGEIIFKAPSLSEFCVELISIDILILMAGAEIDDFVPLSAGCFCAM